MNTGYKRKLQSLPEPLRSQMLYGDFRAGTDDDAWQVIPTNWVEEAMLRWEELEKTREYDNHPSKQPMDAMGCDPARGGGDKTVISRRHGMWFDELLSYPGKRTPDGPAVAGLVLTSRRDKAPVHVDVIGVGGSVYDFLKNDVQTIATTASAKNKSRTKDKTLEFYNQRAHDVWRVREALDPTNNTGIALPRSSSLKADLCAPLWTMKGTKILIESKEDIKKRLGRSTDEGDAVALALKSTPKQQRNGTIRFKTIWGR
jgi:hypothetical protein